MRPHQLDAGLALVGFILGFLGACWLDPTKEQPLLWFESMFGTDVSYYITVSFFLTALGVAICALDRRYLQRTPKRDPLGLFKFESRVFHSFAPFQVYGIICGAVIHAFFNFRAGVVLFLLGVMGHFVVRDILRSRIGSLQTVEANPRA